MNCSQKLSWIILHFVTTTAVSHNHRRAKQKENNILTQLEKRNWIIVFYRFYTLQHSEQASRNGCRSLQSQAHRTGWLQMRGEGRRAEHGSKGFLSHSSIRWKSDKSSNEEVRHRLTVTRWVACASTMGRGLSSNVRFSVFVWMCMCAFLSKEQWQRKWQDTQDKHAKKRENAMKMPCKPQGEGQVWLAHTHKWGLQRSNILILMQHTAPCK